MKPGEEVVFLPTHRKVLTVEMHHQRVEEANPGANCGLNIKDLYENNMSRFGDVMMYKKDNTMERTREFNA